MLKKLKTNIFDRILGKMEATETEFLPAVLEVTQTPPSPAGRIVLWTLFVLVLAGAVWAVFGYVDEVAVAPGKVIPQGEVKVIQAEDKGVVKNILVKDGQKVKKGELLVELDQTVSGADLQRLQKQASLCELEIDRLIAEQTGQPFVPKMHPGLEQRDLDFQMSTYTSRTAEFRAKVSAAEAAVSQNQANLQVETSTLTKYESMYVIAVDKENRIQQLVDQNAVALFTLLDHRSNRIQLEQSIAAQKSSIARAEAALAQSHSALEATRAGYYSEIAAKVLDLRKEYATATEELKKADEKNRLAHIVAPIDGRVTQLAVHTIGGIVTAAQPLMMVVPEDVELVVEAWAANKDIGFIKKGQEAEVKVETFNFQKYGSFKGNVAEISPDAIDDKEKGHVYRILINLEKDNVLVGDTHVNLSPGMTANADIKIKQKRIIEFFLDPFRQYQNEALRER